MANKTFISHISEETEIAKYLKKSLTDDFLGMTEVFVSSDRETIAAGENWLKSIEQALRESSLMIVLCSPASISRPWINFEAGAAWMRDIPLIPICHLGLLPSDLPMPLSLRQGLRISDAEGLQSLYLRVAECLSLPRSPKCDFKKLSIELTQLASTAKVGGASLQHVEEARGIRRRVSAALENPRFRWRSLDRVAAESALSQEQVADLLRSDPAVRFSRGKSGNVIVGLRSRVG